MKAPDQVRDLIHDYNTLAEQYQKMCKGYEEPAKVLQLSGRARWASYLCPECRNQVRPGNACCWICCQCQPENAIFRRNEISFIGGRHAVGMQL